ncbi:MAG: Asp23/Gls24 family envelope stress response protein [Oscillospiraceae bacterium]|nr:Asp23/Gls24 family envelope stress response protein [Oscillospiraceae bacterium]
MVVLSNHLGNIRITKRFFTSLIGHALTDCFGVAGTNARGFWQNTVELLPLLKRLRYPVVGVNVKAAGGTIYIDLHITVLYGVNVAAVVKSIRHKVTYTVEEQTGLKVGRVNVFVDALKS